MSGEGLLAYLTYRVIDPNSGAEIINPLPHLHQSTWTVMAMQAGLPGGGTLGSFKIPLYPPQSEQYAAYKTLYDKLAPGQKIEGYIGNTASGTPKFTGVLTSSGFKRTLTTFEIGGVDTLWWLQASPLLPQENLPATFTGDQILARTNGTQEIMMADDFSGGSTDISSNYQAGTAMVAATDPNFGLPSAKWTSGNNYLIGKTSMSTAQYQLSRADVIGTIVPSTDTGDAGELGILVQSDSTANNGVFGRVVLVASGSVWNAFAQIWSISGGVLTQQASASVFTGLASPFRCQVTLVGTTPGGSGSGQVWRVFVNGQDPGVFWVGSAGGGFTGIRAGGVGTVSVYADLLVQSYRNLSTPRLTPGTVSTGTQQVGQLISSNNQTLLDLWAQAMALDGFYVRKDPGAGAKADSYDFGAAPGTDLSGAVRFEEKGNLVDVEVTSASELYSTDVRMNSVPGGDSGGSITWPKVGNVGDMALIDTVTDVSIPNFTLQAMAARRLQALKVDPWLAKSVIVERGAATADKWRELDYVTLHAPSLNISNLKALVLGYTWTEGDLKQTVYLDQYTEAMASIPARRLAGAVRMLANTASRTARA